MMMTLLSQHDEVGMWRAMFPISSGLQQIASALSCMLEFVGVGAPGAVYLTTACCNITKYHTYSVVIHSG